MLLRQPTQPEKLDPRLQTGQSPPNITRPIPKRSMQCGVCSPAGNAVRFPATARQTDEREKAPA